MTMPRVLRPVRHPQPPVHGGDLADGVVLTPAADVKPESVRSAWKGRIPLGAVTLVVGDPGLGKSTTVVELAARLSRGQLVGDLQGEPVAVALATAEDAIAQVVVPRLLAAGADLTRVLTVGVRRDGAAGGLVLPDDLPALRARIAEAGVRVLVIDPWVAHLTGAVNSHRDHDMRRALAPLARMAEELDLAVVVIAHLNKSEAAEVLHRVGGSLGLAAAARSVLLLGPDPVEAEGPTRVLAHAKCNVGPLMPSLRLRVEGRALEDHTDEDGRPIQTSGIAWLGDAEGVTAADLIAPKKAGEGRDAVAEAMEVLGRLLARGPVASDDVERAREQAGIGERAWRKAKTRLGVKSVKQGLTGGWAWTLPEDGPKTDSRPMPPSRPPSKSSSSSKDDERDLGTNRPSSARASAFDPPEREPGEEG